MKFMTSLKILSVLTGVSLLTSCSTAASDAQSSPKIELTQFEVTHPDSNTTKLVMVAKGTGIAVGSFSIRLDQSPETAKLENYFEQSGYWYLNGGTANQPSPFLMDNGPHDEDPQKGVFVHTFHTQSWPDGRYAFRVSAMNRPAKGDYVADSRGFIFTKGKAAPQQMSNIASAQHQVIYQKDGIYACFPGLFILPDGKIGIRFGTKTVRSHIDNTGGSLSLISGDEGKTWEKAIEPIVDRRWETKDGNFVLPEAKGWVHVDASQKAALEKQHRVIMSVRPGTIAYLGGAIVKSSDDGGKTWQTKEIAVPEDCLGLMNHHAYATYLVTNKGVRLRAVYGRRFQPDAPNQQGKDEVYFLRSTDDGKTWKCFPMYPDGPPDSKVGFNETAIAQAADGTIIAMMRSTEEDYLWQANSKDGGITWSAPIKTPIWGFPADLIRLKDGRLLCSYGYRRTPLGIRASLSRDNGKTWDVDHELIIRKDGLAQPGDVGYPQSYELPDGSIFCVYYITTDWQNTHIASTIFELPSY